MKNFILAAVLTICIGAYGSDGSGRLVPKDFANPPRQYGLDIWWHWPNGNITRDGIRKDLISMHDNGIKRATILNVAGSDQVVPRISYGSDGWTAMFRYALEVADSLGMTIGVHNCDGWSTSGGPWITKEQAMKTYTWRDTWVKGGRKIDMVLEEPSGNHYFYKDWAVVAFRDKKKHSAFTDASPVITHNGKPVGEILTDNNPKSFLLMRKGDKLDITFEKPFEVGSIAYLGYLVFSWGDITGNSFHYRLSYSEDGENYADAGDIAFRGPNEIRTMDIRPVSARWFRLECLDAKIYASEIELLHGGDKPAYSQDIRDFLPALCHVTGTSTIIRPDFSDDATPVLTSEVIDLTGKMSPDGRLVWKAPKGEWRIVRFGYTVTGVVNSPATVEGTGFESDKMDAGATEFHFNSLTGKLADAAGTYTGNTFEFVLADSWECQFTNWTERFPEEFEALNGYPLKSWIPALCGKITGSGKGDFQQETSRFMNDFKKTIAELINRNYYEKMSELAHSRGLQFHAEPIYSDTPAYPPIDALRANACCDMPMTEFWANPGPEKQPAYTVKGQPMSSFPTDACLTEGKQVIGAEAYTGYANFSETPQLLKPFGDAAYCAGINQFILHSYVHQPLDRQPHMTLSDTFGGHYNRNNPWWAFARDWSMYHARIQYVLQHGRPVVDALYFIGDSYPQALEHGIVPEGYKANSCNGEYLDRLAADGFKRLIIPQGIFMEDGTAARIDSLGKTGITIYRQQEGVSIPFDFPPDFQAPSDGRFLFIHKRLDSQDAYFIFNQEERETSGSFTFRVSGKIPEIWDPETGAVHSPSAWTANVDGTTDISMAFKPHQSMFVVFGDHQGAPEMPRKTASLPVCNLRATVSFEPYYDASVSTMTLDSLGSLTEMDDEAVRHFGGTASYTLTFDLPEEAAGARMISLNLGKVSAAAEVTLNGQIIRYVWHDYDDIPVDSLRSEGNILEVRVGTTLRNRMIGDMGLYGKPVNISTAARPSSLPGAGDKLMPSGLAGPVTLSLYE